MILLYTLAIAYIIAINFYSFLLVKTLRDKDRERETAKIDSPIALAENKQTFSNNAAPQRNLSKLILAGALGGALTIYVCMFIFKYKRSDLLLMVLMPILGVLNVYLWILFFRFGTSFFIVR